MIKIVLVGDIGSGKTYISKLFKSPYFSADLEVKKIYKNNRKCYATLRKKFPKFIKTFPIKKKELSNLIKNNLFNLKKIGQVVHPFVRKKLKTFARYVHFGHFCIFESLLSAFFFAGSTGPQTKKSPKNTNADPGSG